MSNSHEPSKGHDRKRPADKCLGQMDPKPCSGADIPHERAHCIMRPDQSEKGQQTNYVNNEARENRLRQVRRRSKHHIDEKIKRNGGPYEALSEAMPGRQ